jgi:hypothetical protein
VKKEKVSLFPDERMAIHAKLGSILKGGDPAEVLLVIILLLALRPVACGKARAAKLQKKKGQPERPPSKTARVLDTPLKQTQSARKGE